MLGLCIIGLDRFTEPVINLCASAWCFLRTSYTIVSSFKVVIGCVASFLLTEHVMDMRLDRMILGCVCGLWMSLGEWNVL